MTSAKMPKSSSPSGLLPGTSTTAMSQIGQDAPPGRWLYEETIPMELIEADFYPIDDTQHIIITAKLPAGTRVSKFARIYFVGINGQSFAPLDPA